MTADILRIFIILIGVALVAVVLIQQPKEGGMAAFGGSSASGSVFGSKGGSPFFFKLTGGLALSFAIAIFVLVKISNSGTAIDLAPIKPDTSIPGSQQISGDTTDSSGRANGNDTTSDESSSDTPPGAAQLQDNSAALSSAPQKIIDTVTSNAETAPETLNKTPNQTTKTTTDASTNAAGKTGSDIDSSTKTNEDPEETSRNN